MSLQLVRTVWPWEVVSITSSVSVTLSAPTTQPTLSVVFMVMMPLPPRPWRRYSSNGVRFADAVFAGDKQSGIGVDDFDADDVIALLGPDAPDADWGCGPCRGASSSWKRMLMPSLVTSTISLLALVSLTPMRRSPFSILMPMMPPLREHWHTRRDGLFDDAQRAWP